MPFVVKMTKPSILKENQKSATKAGFKQQHYARQRSPHDRQSPAVPDTAAQSHTWKDQLIKDEIKMRGPQAVKMASSSLSFNFITSKRGHGANEL